MKTTPQLDAELDLLPEYLHYRDEGCEFDESCLGCHLPVCILDEVRGRQQWLEERQSILKMNRDLNARSRGDGSERARTPRGDGALTKEAEGVPQE